MAPKRLLDQDAQREQRRQQLLLERLSRASERLIAREIASTTQAMVEKWEATRQVPGETEHQRRIEYLLKRVWRAAVEGMAKRISEAAKAKHGPSVSKNQDKWELFTQEYVGQFGGQKIVEITETTRQQVLSGIAIGRRDGVGQRDIAKRIMGQAPSIGRQRAAVIARTETHSAGNYGALKQAEDTGLQMQKEWLAAEGARTRESHNAANGQVVMMNEPFIVGGHEMQYPGDPSGPASETVNCRCSQGFIVMD